MKQKDILKRIDRTRGKRSVSQEKEDSVKHIEEDEEYITSMKEKKGKHQHIENK